MIKPMANLRAVNPRRRLARVRVGDQQGEWASIGRRTMASSIVVPIGVKGGAIRDVIAAMTPPVPASRDPCAPPAG